MPRLAFCWTSDDSAIRRRVRARCEGVLCVTAGTKPCALDAVI